MTPARVTDRDIANMIRVEHARPRRRGDAGGTMHIAGETNTGATTTSQPDEGAALVEFAVLLPLLLLVVLGIVEFGFALSQQLDVRHGAREVSRMVATDDYTLTAACTRMNLASGAQITLAGAGGDVGDEATVTVQVPLQTVTGFFDAWLPANLQADARVRIEQDPSWSDGTGTCI